MNTRSSNPKGVIDPQSIWAAFSQQCNEISAQSGPPEKLSESSATPDDPSPSGVNVLMQLKAPVVPADLAPTASSAPIALLQEVLSHPVAESFDLLPIAGQLVVDANQHVYVVLRHGNSNPLLYKLDTPACTALVAQALRQAKKPATKAAIADCIESMRAEALLSGTQADVGRRVSQLSDGTIVIACFDAENTQILIRPGEVAVVTEGSEALCYPAPASMPMAKPAETGDYQRLKSFLNLDWRKFTLYIGWVTYTLAHAKVPGNVFPLLLLVGGQGSAKSLLTKISILLIDPNSMGAERLPATVTALALSAQNYQLCAYDNVRIIKHETSDTLCLMATRGAVSARVLYTNDGQYVLQLHGAVLLNSIHACVDQPDLNQRTVTLWMDAIPEAERRSEKEMLEALEKELPAIHRGLFDLIAQILVHLPNAKVTHPQRMFEFVRWLAAMEMAHGAPVGTYQEIYADLLKDGQLDTLRDNVLGAAILDFAATLEDRRWSGTPTELLEALNGMKSFGSNRPPRAWPDNEIALSKRLSPLQAPLLTQGIEVSFSRGKQRTITINFKENTNA